jgi:preprotein translocase subunit SecE
VSLTSIFIWVAVVGVAFVVAWRMGYITQLATYWKEMMVELEKCTWPTWEELKGSTALVVVSILLLGGFTAIVNGSFAQIIRWLL